MSSATNERLYPVADNFHQGFYYRRFVTCCNNPANGKISGPGWAFHLSWIDDKAHILDLETHDILYTAVGGFENVDEQTDIFDANLHGFGVISETFKIFHRDNLALNMLGYMEESGDKISIVRPTQTIGYFSPDPTKGHTFLLSHKNLTSHDELALFYMFFLKAAKHYFPKSLIHVLVPMGILGWVTKDNTDIPEHDFAVTDYIFENMTTLDLIINSYNTEHKKTISLIDTSCKLVYSISVDLEPTANTTMHLFDNYGDCIFCADVMEFGGLLTVMYHVDGGLGKTLGYIDEFEGDIRGDDRPNNIVYDGSWRPQFTVVYEWPPQTPGVSKMQDQCHCKMYDIDNPEFLVAEIKHYDHRVAIVISPDSSIPALMKLIIICYAVKLIDEFYTKEYKGQLCVPKLGMIC